MTKPEYLYKYFSVDRTKEILTQNKIFFPTPTDFNDPFDCKFREKKASRFKRERFARNLLRERAPEMPKYMKKKLAKRADFVEGHRRFLNRIHQSVGMLCLTEKRDNVLMWSHYAQKHTGVCLEFQHFSLRAGSLTIAPLQVRYSNEYPAVDFLEMEPFANRSDAIALSKQREFVERIYLTKAKDWEYECEWRVIDFVGARDGHGRGFRPISSEHLTGVIFGCRTTEPDKIKIKQWIALGNTHPTLYEAREGGSRGRLLRGSSAVRTLSAMRMMRSSSSSESGMRSGSSRCCQSTPCGTSPSSG